MVEKVKMYGFSCPRHQAYRGSRCIAPLILNLGTRWRCFMPGNELPYPLKRRMDGFWRRENLFPQPGLEPRTVQPVASRYTDSLLPALFFYDVTARSGFTITLRHATFGRTPLDRWSARRRDLYLTTYNTHKRQTSMSPVGFEPAILASERRKTNALTAWLLGSALPAF
jgi:hypothetical protein